MKAKLVTVKLAEAVRQVRGLIDKDKLSMFSRVLMDFQKDYLTVTGSNGDVQISWRVAAQCDAPCAVTVCGSLFSDFVLAMPIGGMEIEELPKKKLRISCKGVDYRLPIMEVSEYPTMVGPSVDNRFYIDGIALREMLRKVRHAASTNEARKILKCVNMVAGKDSLAMTATDGRRLAHVEISRDCGFEEKMDVSLDSKTVNTLFGIIEDEGQLSVSLDTRSIMVAGESFCLTAKVSAEAYPNWRRVVPESSAHVAKIARVPFMEALERVALVKNDSIGTKMTIENGRLAFSVKNELATAAVEIDACEVEEGVKCMFMVNPKLIAEALSVVDEDEVWLHFDDSVVSPMVIKCSVPWLEVVMPYRVRGE